MLSTLASRCHEQIKEM